MGTDFKKNLKKLIRPIVSFAIRHGFSIQDFIEEAKIVFVEVAVEAIQKKGEKVNSSRLSAMTGVRRPEIKRMMEGHSYVSIPSLVSRVLAQWEQDKRFLTKAGKPRQLSYGDEESDFYQLVMAVSSDLHPSAVLFELNRLELVENKPRGLELKERRHVVTEDIDIGFDILSDDIMKLILAVEQNLLITSTIKNLHAKTYYDNIYLEDIPEIKQWLLSEGAKFHHNVRNFVANYDKDINPKPEKTAGGSISVCTFTVTE